MTIYHIAVRDRADFKILRSTRDRDFALKLARKERNKRKGTLSEKVLLVRELDF